jgi:hypothetical protein
MMVGPAPKEWQSDPTDPTTDPTTDIGPATDVVPFFFPFTGDALVRPD